MPVDLSRPTDADRLLDDLDDSQRRAVVEPRTPLAILAPAGSGKTRVLTRRIGWLATAEAIEPAHVLALTFTRKAAGELRARLRRLGVGGLTAGTFHAVALAQLKARHEHLGTSMPALLDRKARVLAPLVGGPGGASRTLAVLEAAGEIEWAQARLVGPSHYAEAATRAGREPSLGTERMATVYRRYQEEKRKRHVVDFDDLVRLAAHHLEEDADFAATQRWRFRHLFVDEFQDISRAQLRLLTAWLGDREDLCVVGDPDQAIYSFAGADPGYLTRFERHFPGAVTVRLERNYRSTPQIVQAARAVLPSGDRAPVHAIGTPGPVPTVTEYADGDAEARGVADALRSAHAEGRRWSSMAVLYRVNAQSAPFEEALARARIPFRIRGDRAFLDRPEVQQALLELDKLASAAPHRDFAEHLTDLVALVTDPDPEAAREPTADERAHVEALASLGQEYLATVAGRGTVAGFGDFLRTSLRGADDGGVAADVVELLTFHRAKGLEWDTVFVAGLERGLVPISHAHGDPAQLAEERRLLYVALSRAERSLHLSWATQRARGERTSSRTPSPYLAEVVDALGPGDDAPDPGRVRRGVQEARARLASLAEGELGPEDRPLYDALVDWRRDLARAASVPAYVVFDNKTLRALARTRPTGPAELLAVSGVGPVKVERYGAAVLEIVERHTD